MEFPTDVLSLIRDYAKPLPRRTISNYWVYSCLSLESMIKFLKQRFEYTIVQAYRDDTDFVSGVREFGVSKSGWVDGIYTLSFRFAKVHFTMDELLKWNGNLKGYDDDIIWTLEEDDRLHCQVYTTKWKTIPWRPDLSYYWHHS